MSTRTTNFNLIKPELTDTADITEMNQNWDIIDEKLGNIGEIVEESFTNITPESIGAVPNTRTINGKTLNTDIILTADDIGVTVTSDIPLHLRVTEDGVLQIVYDDGE